MKFIRKFIRTVFGLLLAVTLVALAYLHVVGFPDFLKNFVCNQIRRAGIAARFDTIRIDLARGVVAEGAVLADAKTPEQPLMQIDEVQLQLNWRWLMNKQSAVKAIRIANAVISVPTPADETGPEKFTAKDAYATFLFAEDGTIEVDRLSGVYCGIGLYVTGKLKLRSATAEAPPVTPPTPPALGTEQQKSVFRFVTKIVRELNSVQVAAAPQWAVDFNVDLANPLAGNARVRLHGEHMRYRGLNVDNAEVNVELSDGAIEVRKFLAQLNGGELSLAGSYDIAQGRFDLRLSSTTDPIALAVFLPPAVVKVVKEVQLSENPKVKARYVLSPETGSQPQLQGAVETGGLEFRGVKFKSIKFAVDEQGPLVKLSKVDIVTPEGRLTGHGQIHIESSDFAYELESTIDPTKLLPLMTPVMKQIVGPSHFETSPYIVASVTGDFVDPDNFAYDAVVRAGRCSYRDVPIKAVSGKLQLRHSKLDVTDLVLEREEGTLRGHILVDFEQKRDTFEIETTANPTELAAVLGAKAAEFMQPYQFGRPTKARGRGVVDFADATQTAWQAQFTTEQGRYHGVPVPRAAATLNFADNHLEVQDLALTTASGETRGRILSDFNDRRVSFDLESTANLREVAPLIGDRAMDVLQNYRFGPCTQARARGEIDLGDRGQSVWTAQIMNEGFACWQFAADCAKADLTISNDTVRVHLQTEGLSWWKFKADRAQADLFYADNALGVDNFDADFYDGKLVGQARLAFGDPDVKYHLTLDAERADLNRMMNALRGEGREITGALSGHTELEGRGSDLGQLQGGGNLEIKDGVLLSVPVFGILSRIINDVATGAGSTKVTSARATYAIANGVARTDDLVMSAGAFTISSRGHMTLDGKMDFRVQAQFLKAWPGINIITKILGMILEYKVGGTVSEPNYRPVHLPKELLPHDESSPRKPEVTVP